MYKHNFMFGHIFRPTVKLYVSMLESGRLGTKNRICNSRAVFCNANIRSLICTIIYRLPTYYYRVEINMFNKLQFTDVRVYTLLQFNVCFEQKSKRKN